MSVPAPTIVDRIREMARSQPGHTALVQSLPDGHTESVTYEQLMVQVDQATGALSACLQDYDRCGVHGGNSVEFIVQALAVLNSRWCLVPIAEDYDTEALESFVSRCKLHGLIDCGADIAFRSFENPGAVDDQEDAAFRAMEPSFIRFTSGTTNQRKGVVIGRQSVLDRVEAGNRGLQIGPEDRILWLLPMAHHFVVSILLYLRHGATILLPAGENTAEVIRFA
ncbi:MAG: AMP-binding protein, partial [Verrucomicrobiota bacterium]